jgi:signal transduction histidine kinase
VLTDETDRRLAVVVVRLIGLALATWSVLRVDPGLGGAGRSLVVTIALALGAAAWLAWAVLPPDPRVGLVALTLMAGTGGLLTGAAPDSAAAAFVFVAVVAAGVRLEIERAAVVAAVGAGALVVTTLAYDRSTLGLVAYGLGILAAVLVGNGRRQQSARAEQTELLLAQTQRSREEQLRVGRLEESARIAREIHDVLGHALAGLAIQLEATAALVRDGADRDVVLTRVEQAQALAREGLQETRLAVGALRGAPVAARDAIEALVAAHRGAGGTATLTIDGDVGRLTGPTGLAVVRVAQEALTNARKHAPGADVTIALHAGERPGQPVVLVVGDAGGVARADAATLGGYGLRGMRERAEILGGTLAAGPSGAGWLVELRLPGPAPEPTP